MYSDRLKDYKKLEEQRQCKLLIYVTGDRPNLGTQIHPEVVDILADHLDAIASREKTEKISLLLYTSGGMTLAAWTIVNLIRQFCREFEVIIPSKAHSAGTIIALGADKIIMTKQATLSSIDPSFNGALNPVGNINGMQQTVPVSVEAINGFFNFIKDDLKISNPEDYTKIILSVVEKVHPLVLGETYRARNQIKTLAKKLLSKNISDPAKVDKIVNFLSSDSGSHDYTICRKEALENLQLPVEPPDKETYAIIKKIFDSIRDELELNNPYNPATLFSAVKGVNAEIPYTLRQALIESVSLKTHVCIREGIMKKTIVSNQFGLNQEVINDQIHFMGWRSE